MTPTQTAVLVVVLVLVVLGLTAAGVAGSFILRRRMLRRTFGPEYDRVVAERENRVAAERELLERERRHAELDIRPLAPAARERYANAWRAVQTQFVEDPAQAVVSGDQIVSRLAADRGYPTGEYSDQLAYLSVDHARTLEHYRNAHDIYLRGQRGEASTEELRQALVDYRELFVDLLGDPALVPAMPVDGYGGRYQDGWTPDRGPTSDHHAGQLPLREAAPRDLASRDELSQR